MKEVFRDPFVRAVLFQRLRHHWILELAERSKELHLCAVLGDYVLQEEELDVPTKLPKSWKKARYRSSTLLRGLSSLL